MPRAARYVIQEARQVRALTGALPNQIVATLERLGPCSASELAGHLGVPAESLYYHLRRLRQARLLLESGKRPTARRPEAVYEVAGRELVIDPDNRQPRFLEAVARVQRSMMAMAMRLYERALHHSESRRAGSARNLCVIQQNARLNRRDLAELNRKLEDVAQFMAARDRPGAGPFLSVTVSMSPVRDDS